MFFLFVFIEAIIIACLFSSIRFVFFFGDLNYRLDDLDIDVVKEYVNQKEVSVLLTYDQVAIISLCFGYWQYFLNLTDIFKTYLTLLESTSRSWRVRLPM